VAEHSPRKLAVILHADVVGSTALVQRNESVAHERIQDAFRRFSATIESYGGIAHEIRGDALVAEFARASDAVSAALAFQFANEDHNVGVTDDIRPEIRIGISLGEVVIADGTITGAGIVLAQRLEQLAEPGGVCIQGAAYETIPQWLPFEFKSLGEQQLKGFEEPVRAYVVKLKPHEKIPPPESIVPRQNPTSKLPGRPSIAVLPFTNMSGDLEQEYFSDGITEDIITELSRFSMLFVIARHSTFAFKGGTTDVKDMGERLGVRYIVEGSVRKTANRVRISAQLIDVGTGAHIWAERYDRAIEDVFDVQDEVTNAIVATLPGQIEKAVVEHTGRKRTENMTAYDCLLRGNRHYHLFTRDNLLEAKRLYQKAVELDPQFAQAYSRLADTYNSLSTLGLKTDATLADTLEIAHKAVALDNADNWARLALAWALVRWEQFDEAEVQFEKALALNRNDADCICRIAHGFVCLGRAEEGLELISQAMHLNPLHPNIYHIILGNAFYFTGCYEDAVREFSHGREFVYLNHANLAAAYGQLGRIKKAQDEAKRFVEKRRKQLEADGEAVPASDLELAAPKIRRFKYQADRDRFIDGLRKAGLSE
jgi:adenylate cyclase